ncbi:PQ-loop repeat-containing protein [Kistimonas asteriae]|uniref:PQ-loop repeat-containing protein n=1 Tax=Kistimonas asteriae TaxID=517724 RepID=UPI001BAB163E|nr:PQ-loop repeat-containing protein [Kistimonas asteriae]
MPEEKLVEYRKKIDEDEGLQGKRKSLVGLSILMLAINFTGATFKEANTFIFKIEFTNQSGLSYFLLLAVAFLLIRYYTYAHHYHEELYKLWSSRMLRDRKIFYYHYEAESVNGLLANAINVCGGDEPGIQASKYHITGIFKRGLLYPTSHHHEDGIEEYEELISLTNFTNDWRRADYLKLLAYEFKYQFTAFFKYRENLDLVGPYLLGIAALSLTTWKLGLLSLTT